MTSSRRRSSRTRVLSIRLARGTTLVELLVSLVIGLVLAGGMVYAYLQASDGQRATDGLAQLQEAAQVALDAVEADVRLAGFYGQVSDADRIAVPAGLQVRCDGHDASDWVLDLARSVDADNEGYDLPCRARWNTPRADSDVIVVRHANPARALPVAGQVQLVARPGSGQLVADGTAVATPPDNLHDLEVHAWYVNDQASFDGDRPSLRHLVLSRTGSTPVMEDEEIIPGVENLQVLFGVDSDGDGSVERYVEPGDPALADPASIAAVRLWLLVSVPGPNAAFRDERVHALPDGSRVIAGGDPGYPATARRIAVAKTIALRNRRS